MLNKIWFWLLLIGIAAGAGKGVYYAIKGQMPPYLAHRAPSAGEPAPQTEGPAAETASDANRSTLPDETEAKRVKAAVVLRATGEHLTGEALDAAKTAVMLCIGLIGIMALWLGMMNIARDAGLAQSLANRSRRTGPPVLRVQLCPVCPRMVDLWLAIGRAHRTPVEVKEDAADRRGAHVDPQQVTPQA